MNQTGVMVVAKAVVLVVTIIIFLLPRAINLPTCCIMEQLLHKLC